MLRTAQRHWNAGKAQPQHKSGKKTAKKQEQFTVHPLIARQQEFRRVGPPIG
jgi:hypothetical protein